MAIKFYTDDDVNLKAVDTIQTTPRTLDELSRGTNIDTPFLSGMIMLWSGAIGAIPAGWVICDGDNSTPDLRNRFVTGAGDEYAVDATGGESEHTLTVGEIPAHVHAIEGKGGTSGTNVAMTLSVTNRSQNTLSTGGDGAHENKPPYYALAYIMKL